VKEQRREWMNEWIAGWMNEWIGEWINEWILFSIDTFHFLIVWFIIYEKVNEFMNGCIYEWMYE